MLVNGRGTLTLSFSATLRMIVTGEESKDIMVS